MQLLTGNIPRQIVCVFLLSLGWPPQFPVIRMSTDATRGLHVNSFIHEQWSNARSRPGHIIKVPSDAATIALAVDRAVSGDWIIISPGTYSENEIVINKSITVSSQWKTTGDETVIDHTIIDAGDKTLFTITADSVEISGLHMKNGDHTLNILADVAIRKNHFVNNLDAMSFEGPGGGYVGYNFVENDRDDGLDLDIGADKEKPGSNITVEYNTIVNSHDDGIEIRLFAEPHQNIQYIIRNNTIMGSKNAGIQLISYDVFTGKEFRIHHNIISGCKTGLGCMEGSKTREDLSGASKMDERVFFFNNTLSGNQMGATGGNQIIAINNVVERNAQGGFKKFGAQSVIVNNLFFRNGEEDFVQVDESAKKEGNIFAVDPKLDQTTFGPTSNSPCLGAGKRGDELEGKFGQIAAAIGASLASDIGAMAHTSKTPVVEAGDDIVLRAPQNEVTLSGRVTGGPGARETAYWRVDGAPSGVHIVNPKALETRAAFREEGIYQLTLASSDGDRVYSDSKTIRYTHGGDGKTVFLNGETNVIEAEQYGYLYGNLSDVKGVSQAGGFVETSTPGAGERGFVEYFIGTSENTDWTIWLRVKNSGRGKSTLQVNFNNKPGQDLSVRRSKDWHWIRVPGKTRMTAGEWPLLIVSTGSSVQIDKLLLTRDQQFIPK